MQRSLSSFMCRVPSFRSPSWPTLVQPEQRAVAHFARNDFRPYAWRSGGSAAVALLGSFASVTADEPLLSLDHKRRRGAR